MVRSLSLTQEESVAIESMMRLDGESNFSRYVVDRLLRRRQRNRFHVDLPALKLSSQITAIVDRILDDYQRGHDVSADLIELKELITNRD